LEIAEGTKMWWYEDVSRADFEAVKDTIEQIMFRLGASKYEIRLPYEVKTTSYLDDFEETHRSERSVFTYNPIPVKSKPRHECSISHMAYIILL
jgi:hypothetical protein